MFTKISEQIQWKSWEKDPRFQRLELLDRLQDGTFYSHLQYSFYDEMRPNSDEYVKLIHRRPSAQYNLCGMISKMVARKLFAGRHGPRLLNPKEEVASRIRSLIEEAELPKKMQQLAFWGACGSAALTFKIVSSKMTCCVWRAKFCQPFFSDNCDLNTLRVQYVVPGCELIALDIRFDNIGEEIKPGDNYWFCMDHRADADVTYYPVKVDAKDDERTYIPIDDPEWTVSHALGVTQAHWFENLSGGVSPDGAATFQYAIPMSIEIDYTLSQLGAAIRYNASPQLVIVGDVRNGSSDGTFARSPANTLHLEHERKDNDGGVSLGRGDAKLLEMTGNGINAGLDYVDKLRKFALEQISAVRKDPEQLKGALAAKAMEMIDEEFIDLVNELRTSYGEGGYLPCVKKMAKVAILAGHPLMEGVTEQDVDLLTLQWPKIYTPTAAEAQQLSAALVQAVEAGILDKKVASSFLANALDAHAPTGTEERADQSDNLHTKFSVPAGLPNPVSSAGASDGKPIDLLSGTSSLPGEAKDYGSKTLNV